jgi:hypothetical protein
VEQDCISKGSISQELLPRLEKTIQRRSNFVVSNLQYSILNQIFSVRIILEPQQTLVIFSWFAATTYIVLVL